VINIDTNLSATALLPKLDQFFTLAGNKIRLLDNEWDSNHGCISSSNAILQKLQSIERLFITGLQPDRCAFWPYLSAQDWPRTEFYPDTPLFHANSHVRDETSHTDPRAGTASRWSG